MPQEPSPEQREMAWRFNLNTCHVWAEDGEQVQRLQAGGDFEPPIWAQRTHGGTRDEARRLA